MKILGLIVSLVSLMGCSLVQAQRCGNLEQLQWLVGNWESANKDQITLESWEKTSELTYEGAGITLSNSGEELGREGLRLLVMKDQIFYLAKVDHNALPIPFVLTHCRGNRFVFQNPQHDFPKVITYDRQDDKKFKVTVSDGADRSSALEFKKQEK